MQYELYIDVLFLVNLMMDYILLLLTRKILSCTATHGRICLGALTGALLTCLVIAVPVPYAFIKIILFHGVVNVVMLKVGLGIKWNKTFIKAYVMLYAGGFLLGGVAQWLHQYVRMGSLLFALALASYYIALGIWNLISHMAKIKQYSCEVILYKGDANCKVLAMIDSGNCLRDALTGKPVSIVEQSIAKSLCDGNAVQRIRFIPYQSVGKKDGVMPLMELDRLKLCGREEKWIECPLIAVCDDILTSDRTYKMLMNPEIL